MTPRARYSGDPLPVPVVVRVPSADVTHSAEIDGLGRAITTTHAAAGYLAAHERMRDAAALMAEVGDEGRASLFRRFAFYALRASRAEVA